MYSAVDLPPSVGTYCDPKENKTRESEAAECDINRIVARFEKTGELPMVPPGFFADVSEMGDYRTALDRVRQAEALFLQLPVAFREEMQNDVGEFLDFAADPANADRLKEVGLITAEEVVEPLESPAAKPPVVEPPPAAPVAPKGA